MRLSSLAAAGALLAAQPAAAAVFRDQVGRIDFHYSLAGLPQTFASFFHRPRPEDKASLLYSLSDAAGGVLAAVNPSSGALVWRQLLAEADGDEPWEEDAASSSSSHVLSVPGEGWLATGRGAAVSAWNAVSGRGLWQADVGGGGAAAVAGLAVAPPVFDPADGLAARLAARHDVLALVADPAAGTVLHRLGGADGRVLWSARDGGHGLQPLHVAVLADQAFVVGLHGSQLKVLVVDLKTGHRVTEHTLGGDVSPADVLFVGNGGADPAHVAPVVVWADGGRTQLRVQVLAGGKHLPAKHTSALPPATAEVLVHAVRQPQAGAAARPVHFLVHARTAGGRSHSGAVYHVDGATHAVAQAYALPAAAGLGAFAASVSDNTLYFTRITDDEVVLTASGADRVLGRWPLAAAAPAGAAAAEVAAKPGAGGDGGFAVRAAVVTADDDWVLVLNGQTAWTRPEGLAGAVAGVLAEPPAAAQQLVRALEQEAHSNPLAAYAHRVRRHVADLQKLPAFLQALPGRLARSVLGGGGAADSPVGAADPFGFHKLAVLATRRGRLYGLDAASPGAVQWTTKVPQAPTAAPWAVQRIHVDEAAGVALVVGPTVRTSALVRVATGALLPLAGEDVPAFAAAFAVVDPDAKLASTTWVTGADGARWVLPVLEQADGAEAVPAAALAQGRCPRESIVVRSAGGGLEGVRFVSGKDGACAAQATWVFAPPAGFRIATVATRPAHDPVASIGRVLADRRVLYKYLNANVAVVAAVDDAAAALLTVVLDTVSGQVLATAAHAGVDGRKPVDCLVVENSVLCTFFGDTAGGGEGGVKGYQLALSDLYESRTPNERVSGPNGSAVQPLEGVAVGAGGPPLPAVFAQTWVLSTRLTALAATQTRQGISVREVLAFAPRQHGVVGLPRVGGVLDARRPVGRDATAGEAMDEGLARYAPALAPGSLDGRQVLSHARDVAGVRALATAPTHVESTSLVLAFGALDVFGTRATPSLAFDLLDQGFNKLSMLGTVAALAVGVAVLRPMVAKKQIDLRWSAPL